MTHERLAKTIRRQLAEIATLSGINDAPETARDLEAYEALRDKLREVINWMEAMIDEKK